MKSFATKCIFHIPVHKWVRRVSFVGIIILPYYFNETRPAPQCFIVLDERSVVESQSVCERTSDECLLECILNVPCVFISSTWRNEKENTATRICNRISHTNAHTIPHRNKEISFLFFIILSFFEGSSSLFYFDVFRCFVLCITFLFIFNVV